MAFGFSNVLTAQNLLASFIGALAGTIVGVLPGLGPSATMALLLPMTLTIGPTAGLIMLAGVWYGAQYGGSTTSILMNLPGEAASVVTTIDGHQMALKGRAGAALAVVAIGSWIAGTAGTAGLMLFAPPLARAALAFGPPEYFAIAALGMIILTNIAGGRSTAKNFVMAVFGISLSTIGMDSVTGTSRFVYDIMQLRLGIDFIPVIMGVYGIAEVLEVVSERKTAQVFTTRFRDLYPKREELKRMVPPALRGTVVGFFVGLIPGPMAIISTFVSYAVEKRFSRHRHELGQGAVEGVAGPEAANNAACPGMMVPLLALGLPFTAPTALLLGGLVMFGIQPGPQFITEHADIFWTFIASMYLGNLMLLILNLPLVGVFASILKTPARILMPLILLLCIVGSYSVNNEMFEVWVMLVFGILGYFMRRFGFDAAPLVLGLVLGKMLERSFRQALIMFDGNLFGFWLRPLSGILLSIGLAIIVLRPLLGRVKKDLVSGAATRDGF